MSKKIIPYINCEIELPENIISTAVSYEISGADELFLYNYTKNEESQEKFLSLVRSIEKQIDIPILIGYYVERFEDIKKAFYTGAKKVVIRYSSLKEDSILKDAADRFGKDKLILEIDGDNELGQELQSKLKKLGVYGILLKHVTLTKEVYEKIEGFSMPIIISDSLLSNDILSLLKPAPVIAVTTNYYKNKEILKDKNSLKSANIDVNTFNSSMEFSEFKLDNNGLIPVIVQDYKTGEVLMLAYMNEEAYHMTINTGKMTYYSRSRKSLWIKGETSGHYQYVKTLMLDCDNDTILAKVKQIGAACHTGSHNCFFNPLVIKEYNDMSPLTVFNDVYNIIIDRKKNPKEGSYTNYLFDKGIDKILKKCGEEATEIIIAAKNPNVEELKYEISDFLYHMMVLMAECNLDPDDIMKELANRR